MVMVVCPGMNTDRFPDFRQGMSTDELITCFERSYSIWILAHAKKLLTDPDAGFAILMLLNPYPEIIGRIVNRGSTAEITYQRGLFDIFPTLHESPHSEVIAKHLYDFMRNGLAHASFTDANVELTGEIKAVLEAHTADKSLNPPPPERVYVQINPVLWFGAIQAHLWEFTLRLRDHGNDGLRKRFREWMRDPLGKRQHESTK